MKELNRLRIDRTRVQALMTLHGVDTMQELSERSGVHVNTLTVVLRGGRWSAKTIERLAIALDCNPVDLLVADGFPAPFSVAPVRSSR